MKQNVSQDIKSLHFLSKRQKFSLAKKKETTKKKKKKKKKRLLCAAGSDDGVHHPDIINFFYHVPSLIFNKSLSSDWKR